MPRIARLDLEITLQYIKSVNKMLLIFKELLLFVINCLYFFNQGNRENCLYSSIASIRGFTVFELQYSSKYGNYGNNVSQFQYTIPCNYSNRWPNILIEVPIKLIIFDFL